MTSQAKSAFWPLVNITGMVADGNGGFRAVKNLRGLRSTSVCWIISTAALQVVQALCLA